MGKVLSRVWDVKAEIVMGLKKNISCDFLMEMESNEWGSKRHSLQAVELSQRTQVAVQLVSNLPAPFLGMPAMRTRWMAGASAHKSG